jgi:hypothetical protein
VNKSFFAVPVFLFFAYLLALLFFPEAVRSRLAYLNSEEFIGFVFSYVVPSLIFFLFGFLFFLFRRF